MLPMWSISHETSELLYPLPTNNVQELSNTLRKQGKERAPKNQCTFIDWKLRTVKAAHSDLLATLLV